ncbi:nucleotidyl transferase AbiEii/AbiGii toxin family protein [Bifidobacterium sp. ESL0775]|uniref:nucleotidyl transferase AbiEii/AbiGii toxin family protein n=1 Tax=Bifidobacterium sp. ESL0775 TaxID=2983230 RepID=UPI0023F871DD|nr:nucleotidyl transferase AbiEii/AbiGii toxin family protein [Bifidobacterium sp. ESL0775]WEV68920.1 nucleotidyl transferase AbiEii/AbiGii toxin family protein [Bifidobacterium sp. ESL0775]
MNPNGDASLRGKVRTLAQANHLSAQEILQMVIFEHFLERLAKTQYSDQFILKGGLLISSLIGISGRTTMDLDATIRGISMEKEQLKHVLQEICDVDLKDEFSFVFERLEPIREKDKYADFRAHLRAKYGRIDAPLKLDLTTGDAITPNPIDYNYPTLMDGKTIRIKAYPIETLIAEKIETVIRRGSENGRARDFYDLDILYRRFSGNLDSQTLNRAITNTAKNRGSYEIMQNYESVCDELRNSDYFQRSIWKPYIAANSYAAGRSFDEVIDSVIQLGKMAGL